MAFYLVFLFAISALVTGSHGCGYASCPASYPAGKLHVHLISHAHEDVGWLKTPDGYADEDVSPMLTSVTEALQKSPDRRFTLVEIYYIKRWWQRQSKTTQDAVRKLVANGQMQFANAGWVANDEAPAHYEDIIDQLTLGVEWVRETFGACAEPKVSWQIDAFGHSREMANLYSQAGYDGHVTNRGTGALKGEFRWNASSAGHEIFTTHLHGDYNSPGGYNFEDNDHVTDENLKEKTSHLVDIAKNWNKDYGSHNHVMILFGGDNKYTHAEKFYSALDRIIAEAKKDHTDVELFYSTPTCYVKAVLDSKPALEVKTGDYHPFWTGFYSGRPVVKYLVRYASGLLAAAKQLEVLADLGPHTRASIQEGRNELAVLQHHDAITGTSRPHVMIDYKWRLVSAIKATSGVIAEALGKLAHKAGAESRPYVYSTVNVSDLDPHWTAGSFASIVYNPLAQPQHTWVRIPVTDAHAHKVFDRESKEITGKVGVVPISGKVHSLLGHRPELTHELIVPVSLPALGFETYFFIAEPTKLAENHKELDKTADGDLILKGRGIELVVNHKTGQAEAIVRDGRRHPVNQKFYYYNAHSAVWEFCPSSGAIDVNGQSAVISSGRYGEGYSEVTQKVTDWIWQTIRVYDDQEHVELDWTVGPLPEPAGKVVDGEAVEVVSRFEATGLANKGVLYHDANGRQTMKRHRNPEIRSCQNTHQNITYNFYPATSRAWIRDEDSGLELLVIPDRSAGAATLADGQLEFLIHRRIFGHLWIDVNMDDRDPDGKGVVTRGKFYLYLTEKGESAIDHARQMGRQVAHQPIVALSTLTSIDEYKKDRALTYSGLKASLPDNIHLQTLEAWGPVDAHEVLLRLENFYDVDDAGSRMNSAGTVKLADISVPIESIEKANLVGGARSAYTGADVALKQQDIATFVLKIKKAATPASECRFAWTKLANGQLPARALQAGYEADGRALYICRHKDQADLIPGKYSSVIGCHVSLGGKEAFFNDGDVELLTAEGAYQWTPRHGGDALPDRVYVAGTRGDGLPLYIGRCPDKHGLMPGKVDEYFYYAYGGAEYKDCVSHEILTC